MAVSAVTMTAPTQLAALVVHAQVPYPRATVDALNCDGAKVYEGVPVVQVAAWMMLVIRCHEAVPGGSTMRIDAFMSQSATVRGAPPCALAEVNTRQSATATS
jgi:hypothetical protein